MMRRSSFNRALSKARAEAVAAWLTQAGTARWRIASNGHGPNNPVATNTKPDGSDDPAGRQKNRRVTVTL